MLSVFSQTNFACFFFGFLLVYVFMSARDQKGAKGKIELISCIRRNRKAMCKRQGNGFCFKANWPAVTVNAMSKRLLRKILFYPQNGIKKIEEKQNVVTAQEIYDVN